MRQFVPEQALFFDVSSPPLPAVRQQSCFSNDEARRIAANVGKLPELLRKP